MVKVKYGKLSNDLKEMAAPSPVSSTRSSIGLENHTAGEVLYIQIDSLIPFSNQARKLFKDEEILALAETIKEHGIRNPLTVIRSTSNKDFFEVVSGERRLRAARIAGLKKLPCIVLSDRKKAEEISIIENIHRTDLHPLELAAAYKKLYETGLYQTQNELANKLSITESSLSEYFKYTEIPQFVQEHFVQNDIRSRDMLRTILNLKDEEKIKQFLKVELSSNNLKPSKTRSHSLIRIALNGGKFKIQKRSISLLSSEQREDLKQELIALVNSL